MKSPSTETDLEEAIAIAKKNNIQNAEQANTVLWVLRMLDKEHQELKHSYLALRSRFK